MQRSYFSSWEMLGIGNPLLKKTFSASPNIQLMDNLPAHKLASIEHRIESYGSRVLNLSPYPPDFNSIELWWSQLKYFLRSFYTTQGRNG